jgi:hypothetical protein
MIRVAVVVIALTTATVSAAPSWSTTCVPPTAHEPAVATLEPICQGVYVEPATTPAERQRLVGDVPRAIGTLRAALGELRSDVPVIVLCKTVACQLEFAGDAKRSTVVVRGQHLAGATYVPADRTTVVIVRVDPQAANVLVHELVHVELGARTGSAFVPAWFQEGIAASIGDEPQCRGPAVQGIDDLRRLDSNRAWLDYTNRPGTLDRTYCQARREVETWLHRPGRRLSTLIDAVRGGAAFYDVYGAMLTQRTGPVATVTMSPAAELGDHRKPFTLAMWIKPTSVEGVLAHVSTTDVGLGWCMPLLGFNESGRLVAQVPHDRGPELSHYAVATDTTSRALHRWTHVAMTWAPGTGVRLYVDGIEVAGTPSPRYDAAEERVYVTWGSSNVGGGPGCWKGAIDSSGAGTFDGSVTDERIFSVALDAASIATLAAARP